MKEDQPHAGTERVSPAGEDPLRERLPHGDALFPLMVHEMETDSRFRERVNCHWHDEIEILTVTRGTAQAHINGRVFPVKEGSILFIPSNCLHSFTGQPNVPFHFFAIVFHPALLNSFVNDVIQQRYIDSVSHGRVLFPEHILPMEEWEQRVHRLLLDIRDCFRQKETAFELLIKIRLYAVWYLMYTHADTSAAGPAECSGQGVAAVRSVIEYIRAHYESPVTLPELSRAFHISEGHLCRLFKSVTGMSITEYVNYFRISIAASLLLDTHADVGEIAGMAGFNSISYFNKVFRKHLHMTPSKFRRSRPPEKGSTEWETHFISHGSRR